jgi:hypothetical protein
MSGVSKIILSKEKEKDLIFNLEGYKESVI